MFSWIARGSFLLSIVTIAGAMGLLYAGMQVPGEALAVNSVSVGDNFFQPGSITVQAGSAVEWTNAGNLPHTATASNNSFDSGMLKNGQSFSQVFEVAGTFSYVCAFHPEMVGAVVVEAAAQPTAVPTVAPAAAAPDASQQQAAPAVAEPGALPVGGGPPMAPGTTGGAIALAVIGLAFAALGVGAMTLAARTKQGTC